MKTAVIVGAKSHIGAYLSDCIGKDGFKVIELSHGQWFRKEALTDGWDLIVFALGTMRPIGKFAECDVGDWLAAIDSNALSLLTRLHHLYPARNPGAQVCFFSGPNPHKPNPFYSAYDASKALLINAAKNINAEGLKCFVLGPGYVPTKIHQQTIAAGVPNERLARAMANDEPGTPLEKIYACLRWCMDNDVGGQHIFIPEWKP
jgi:NAD(P)-dependent dehydrogenase (short-subunit alcohol dehydrogenase family)